jgi:hypothetical protein
VNGAPQKAYIPKEDVVSPTVSTELMFITLSIAASENRHVQCYDVLSAFVNTDVDENVLIVLKGELAKMMVHIAPQIYCKHITIDKKGMPVLKVNLQKALYRLMRAKSESVVLQEAQKRARRFWTRDQSVEPLCGEQRRGRRVANNPDLARYVDDLIASWVVDFELPKLSCYLANIYGPKLTMHMGCKHDYLGVNMELQEDRKLNISIINYLKEVIQGIP